MLSRKQCAGFFGIESDIMTMPCIANMQENTDIEWQRTEGSCNLDMTKTEMVGKYVN